MLIIDRHIKRAWWPRDRFGRHILLHRYKNMSLYAIWSFWKDVYLIDMLDKYICLRRIDLWWKGGIIGEKLWDMKEVVTGVGPGGVCFNGELINFVSEDLYHHTLVLRDDKVRKDVTSLCVGDTSSFPFNHLRIFWSLFINSLDMASCLYAITRTF